LKIEGEGVEEKVLNTVFGPMRYELIRMEKIT
jgi:hypothetical protein